MTKQELIGTKAQRQARIGGSEFATVMDINPYKKRIELVLEKAGVIANTFEGNDATRRGEFLENDIIAKFEDATGLTVSNEQQEFIVEPNDCLPLVCHVDGITSDDAVFEAKTTDIKSKTWSKGIPPYYKAQLEMNCKLANKKKAYIAVGYCEGDEIVKFEYFEHKPEMPMSDIVGYCQDFTNDVEKYKSYGVVNNGLILKSKIDNNLIEELENINETISKLKQKIKPYEDQKKIIETKLKEQIGDNWGIENDLYKITMSNRITAPSYEYKVSRSGLKIERKEV